MENKEEIISFDRKILKEPKVKIFSKTEGDTVKYIISLDSKDEAQTHEERIALATFEQGNPRLLKKQIVKLLSLVSEERVDKTDVEFSVKQLGKKSDIEITREMQAILDICSDREKKDLEEIPIKRETKIEEIIPDKSMNYNKIDGLMPEEVAVKLVGFPDETIKEVGEESSKRLEVLKSIKSPEDAEEHKDSLEHFMTYKEKPSEKEKMLLSFMQKLDELDPRTIIDTLKVIEDEDIKYSKLYPMYLRVQEKRIIKKVQEYLIGLKLEKKVADGEIEKFLELLDSQKMEDLQDTDISGIESSFADREAEQLEQYLSTGRSVDIQMLKYIKSIGGQESEEKQEVEEYLKCRIASLRQVGEIFDKFELRGYIEDTSFKDADEMEQNVFLQNIADIEKKYILEKYGEILNKYNERNNGKPQTLQQYNYKLKQMENQKGELQELLKGYTELVNGKKSRETGDEGRNEE